MKKFVMFFLFVFGNSLYGMGRWVCAGKAAIFEGQPWLHVNGPCYYAQCSLTWQALLNNRELGPIAAFVLAHGAGKCDDRGNPLVQPVKK